jgi:hypothetical protein
VIARDVVDEVLAGAITAEVSPVPGQPEVTASPGAGRSPVIGVLAVPPWRPGLEADVLPRDYRDLLGVAGNAGRPLRGAQIAAAAGLSTDRGKVETLRAKLKRLAERGWLAEEAGPGLFALPARRQRPGRRRDHRRSRRRRPHRHPADRRRRLHPLPDQRA